VVEDGSHVVRAGVVVGHDGRSVRGGWWFEWLLGDWWVCGVDVTVSTRVCW
jgi:hypothetical protein